MEERETGLIEECISKTPGQGAPASAEPAATTKISDFLPIGKENAISAQALCDLLHYENIRSLQAGIARERAAGAVILSTCQNGGGYFLPKDKREIRRFIQTLENRAYNTLAALQSAWAALGQRGDNT